jgi:hypothetical protein
VVVRSRWHWRRHWRSSSIIHTILSVLKGTEIRLFLRHLGEAEGFAAKLKIADSERWIPFEITESNEYVHIGRFRRDVPYGIVCTWQALMQS